MYILQKDKKSHTKLKVSRCKQETEIMGDRSAAQSNWPCRELQPDFVWNAWVLLVNANCNVFKKQLFFQVELDFWNIGYERFYCCEKYDASPEPEAVTDLCRLRDHEN